MTQLNNGSATVNQDKHNIQGSMNMTNIEPWIGPDIISPMSANQMKIMSRGNQLRESNLVLNSNGECDSQPLSRDLEDLTPFD